MGAAALTVGRAGSGRAFELSRFEGLTHKEIEEGTDIAPRTVNNHIVSALNTLKELYEGYKADRTQVA